MDLKFTRKMSKSDNHQTLVTIPKAVADNWIDSKEVNMIFKGDRLILIPVKGV